MANQVIPRLNGDEYQHLYSWLHVLLLLKARERVTRVRVEDRDAGSVDDVTVHHDPQSGKPEEFYHYFFQVKYHETQEELYSSAKLMVRKEKGRSLLQKFFGSWEELRVAHAGRLIRLHLVSNWAWSDSEDKIGSCIGNFEGLLRDEFFNAGPKSDIGKSREEWRLHLGTDSATFEQFARCLHFYLGEGLFRQLQERVSERMEMLGLLHDANALAVAVDIIRNWIRGERGDITLPILEQILNDRQLHLPPSAEACVTIHLNTITEGAFDLDPDFKLDWRKYFEGRPGLKGHQLKNPENWNKRLLPELHLLQAEILKTSNCRFIRARGLARLSAWFAFGFTFSEVAGFVIEVEQQDEKWRTDSQPSFDFKLQVLSESPIEGEVIAGVGDTVACGISVTGSLSEDVRKHLTGPESAQIAALLLIQPERELGRGCLQGPGDAMALARGVKELVRPFVKRWGAKKLFLYYFGPLSGACFIGHQLNAVCREIQVMEDQQPGYARSFLLN